MLPVRAKVFAALILGLLWTGSAAVAGKAKTGSISSSSDGGGAGGAVGAGATGIIKHIVVLMEENRSFDHFFGWSKLAVNKLKGDEFNLKKVSDPTSQRVKVSATAPYVNPCDPNHGTPATTEKIFGSKSAAGDGGLPNMSGFVAYEDEQNHASKQWCAVMEGFTPERLPVISALASEFAIMDRFFCSHPGPTWPNRLFALSATSAGDTETGTWYRGKKGSLFPQKTIFDQVHEAGLSWRNYFSDAPWELFLKSLSTSPENIKSLDHFYEDARTGNLPSYAWINPRAGMNRTTGLGSNDQHPDHDVALGERFYKSVYEALRASPAWNETLFIVTFDEHGGFYDHVPPPQGVPAPGDNETSYPDTGFNFDRLGVRIPTLLISPWIPRGTVISAPPKAQKPANNSEYDLTSIMATARKLLGIADSAGPLTKRDAWAATFEHVLSLPQPRTDAPMQLPDAPQPSLAPEDEAKLPLNDLQQHIGLHHANAAGVPFPPAASTETKNAGNNPVFAQGDISEWLQRQFNRFTARSMRI
eukprot:UC1_evm1s1858